ncbi:MAG: hypothetical protein ACXVB9_12320 [Bdellovibrionota bacterium]
MKKLLTISLFFICAPAFASSFVCSNFELYYSRTTVDSGIPPRPGTYGGELLVVYRGKIVDNVKLINGQPDRAKYSLSLSDEIVLKEQSGGSGYSKISQGTATLKEKAGSAQFSDVVVCETNQNFVP